MKWYTTEKIGRTRRLTPEGFLVIEGAPIARTGVQVYAAQELPELDAGRDSILRIEREPAEVFRVETIASAQGKAVTDDHPSDDVTPADWRELSLGSMQNIRRGEGGLSDFLLADLFITDPDLIARLSEPDADLPELSCGYDAEYEQLEPGRGRQHNIIVNHVALVERGRCGPACAIGDSDMTEAARRAAQSRDSIVKRIKRAFGSKDAKALDAALAELPADMGDEGEAPQSEAGGGGVTQHFHIGGAGKPETDDEGGDPPDPMKEIKDAIGALATRMDAFEKRGTGDAEEEESDETDDAEPEEKRERTGDAAAPLSAADAASMRKVIQSVRAQAEILSPGINVAVPTADAGKTTRKKVRDSLCSCKRKALDVAYRTNVGAKVAIDAFLNGSDPGDFRKLSARTIDTVFTGASELIRAKNNGLGARSTVATQDFGKAPMTNAALNERFKAHWNPPAGGNAR